MDGRSRSLCVVIPALNEARNIAVVLKDLPPEVDEVILVDGASVDGTVEAALAVRPDITVVRQGRRGKGNALAAGFAAARSDYLVMIDADGSMAPAEIQAFTAALDAGADYAKGSRYASGGGSEDISLLRSAGNRGLNGLTNLLFRTRFSDLCYGYNAFRRDCIPAFGLPDPFDRSVDSRWGDGFEIETLLNVRMAKAGKAIVEVPSFERPRLHGESNLRTFRDGARVLATILRERVARKGVPATAVVPLSFPRPRAEVVQVLPRDLDAAS